MEFFYAPWPWYVAGVVIGLTVPTLLLLGNKKLGISSTLRQICAACYPAKIPFFHYDWKKDSWNLFFAAGILLGGFLGGYVFANPEPVAVTAETKNLFLSWGLDDVEGLLPQELFNWENLITAKGFLLMVVGGFLVGFGTRYAGGCTSGHGILGLSALQWPSLVATACFFIGGIIVSHFVLPYILAL
ncbi:YeeE/YedE family protein [Fulvivirgaceae bacterium PWU4]|uniref:YeeE/YedE family protein n=1 Tax=Chryseosolibacter histidini TaxID=2782349 RepID=A0AAP2DJ63_9BACT|nr:YeeE/YedE thiosulfate transporter family protein [Chryseosolibacter histidini]MBT1697271.1 YeeE/YedE family protein [Chryseosolibacter histidini]